MFDSLVQRLERLRASIFLKLLGGFLTVCVLLLLVIIISLLAIGQLANNIGEVQSSQANVNRANNLLSQVRGLNDELSNLRADLKRLDELPVLPDNFALEPRLSANNLVLQSYKQHREGVETITKTIQDNKGRLNIPGLSISQPDRFLAMLNAGLPTLLQNMDAVKDKFIRYDLIAAHRDYPTVAARADAANADVQAFITGLETDLNSITKASEHTVDDAYASRDSLRLFLIGLGIFVLIAAVLAGSFLSYVVTRPVQKLRSRLESLAEGDLQTPLVIDNQDQFGDLARTFNQSLRRLGGVVEDVQGQAVRVSSAAAEIAAASRQSALISADQASSVAEATVTIEELNRTAKQIAEAARQVAVAAEQALVRANDGQDTVRESITGINMLKNQVQDIAIKILALTDRSQRVGHIIEQITGIAEQTHLLALNAAIESAAAGEAGKRFGVVAAEVKKLAERSRNATKEVQAVLSEIQLATNASVMATEQGMKQAEAGVVLAHKSGEANETIMQMVERTVQLANAISLATQQQRGDSEQVVNNMRQLATVIQDGAATARQSSSLAASLDQIATELRTVSTQFKVAPQTDDLDDNDRGGFSSAADGSAPDYLDLSAFEPYGDERQGDSRNLHPDPA